MDQLRELVRLHRMGSRPKRARRGRGAMATRGGGPGLRCHAVKPDPGPQHQRHIRHDPRQGRRGANGPVVKLRSVLVAPEAEADLMGIYGWIAERASPEVALRDLDRVEASLRGVGAASERGHLRSDVRPNLRILGYERRLTIALMVSDEAVTVLRVFRACRDWESVFAEGE